MKCIISRLTLVSEYNIYIVSIFSTYVLLRLTDLIQSAVTGAIHMHSDGWCILKK